VILIDANLLVYAHVSTLPQHAAARDWLDRQLNGSAQVGLPWPSLLSFLRLVTNGRIFEKPAPIAEAWKQVDAWLGCERAWIPQPTERHQDILGTLIRKTGAKSDLIPDAHLAALACEHGLTLCSSDGDFARFKDLDWINPLED